jgi:acetylornithine deacetylase/succinyl-diaminopimelate desuccinylase-like protein
MDQQVFEWCRRLIACRSVTGEGTREIAELCARQLLIPHGLEPRLIRSQSEGDSQVNLLCTVPGRDHDCAPLVLNTHLDTVPPGDPVEWTECPEGPFAATFKGERIYGLGAADTKLDFIAKAVALAECGTPRRDVYLVATFGEEHGLVGAKEIAAAGLLPKGALVFVGEPSRLQVITAHKGLMVFQLEIRFQRYRENGESFPTYSVVFNGRSAHSSTPALGLNAIGLAVETLAQRPDIRIASIDGGDAVNKVPARCEVVISGEPAIELANATRIAAVGACSDFISGEVMNFLSMFIGVLTDFADRTGKPEPDYTAPTLTCNPGVIHSHGQTVLLEFELRPPPALSLDEVRKGVARLVEAVSGRWPDLQVTLTERRSNPGFRSAFGGETVELAMAALAAVKLPLEAGVKAGCTEAGIYAAAGLRPVVFGPGPSTGVIHAPNEYNLVADVVGALRFYRELLRQ